MISFPDPGRPADWLWVALSLVDHLGGSKLLALAAHFDGNLPRLLAAPVRELQAVRGIGPRIAAGIAAVDLAALHAQMSLWTAEGVRCIPLIHPDYPASLKTLPDPPATLFVRGWADQTIFGRPSVAIIGTRTPSPSARQAARHLAMEAARRGEVVISGLALGIDAAAHTGALDVPTGGTLAVLGGGVLNVYPPGNRPLAEAVMGCGLLLCETHPAADVNPSMLVARNRIISGLAGRVIVVETAVTGGAMHAARRAHEQGRAVYTVDPAALDGDVSGNRALIEAGCRVIAPDATDLP